MIPFFRPKKAVRRDDSVAAARRGKYDATKQYVDDPAGEDVATYASQSDTNCHWAPSSNYANDLDHVCTDFGDDD